MELTCKDDVFGEMTYKHRWYKQQMFSMFGKEWNVTVVAKAYSGKPITEEQQKSYSDFLTHKSEMISTIGEQLKEYVNANLQELAVYWKDAKNVNNINDLAHMVSPKTLLFKQDGTTIILLDCVWDEEHGVAVKLTPKVEVGSQDLFL